MRCTSSSVRFQAIAILTPLILERGVPVHGEVCPVRDRVSGLAVGPNRTLPLTYPYPCPYPYPYPGVPGQLDLP